MKTTFYTLIVLAALVSCTSYNYSKKNKVSQIAATANDTIRIANDSLEYEIIIIEQGFNAWLAQQPPRGYFTQSAMEITNAMKVNIYNMRVNDPLRYGLGLYELRIDYDRDIDYGYEVNYMLYNYFIFFEQRYKQRLL